MTNTKGNFSGEYESEDSVLKIQQLDNKKIKFSIVTANARGCTGEINAATALLQGNKATFMGENQSNLIIEFNGQKGAIVREKNCSNYHGAMCSFIDTYSKK